MPIQNGRVPGVFALLTAAVVCTVLSAQQPGQKANDSKPSVDEDFPVKMDAVAEKRAADGKQRIIVTLTLEKDFYVYANPPGDQELVPAQTTLRVTSKNPPKSVDIIYAKGEAMDTVLGTLMIYTGKVKLEAVVERAAGDTEPLIVIVKVQPFNAKTLMCRWRPTELKKSMK
jgi:hypothetical protein